MFSLSIVIIASLVSLLIGSIVGVLLSGNLNRGKNSIDSDERLANTEETLLDYQRDVAEHFAQTTKLVNTLTESYRDMHEHLASSALKLSTPEISRQLISSGSTYAADISESDIHVPKDWAPKKHGEEGALSESYGLEDQPLEQSDGEDSNTTPETPNQS